MWIVIGIVVFLVVALVILTIFGQTVATFTSIGQAEGFCATKAAASCRTTNSLPADWTAPNVRYQPDPAVAPVSRSCQSFFPSGQCSNNEFASG